MSRFNLFSCHKFLEQSGSALLAKLAKYDTDDMKTADEIGSSIAEFSERLKGHASWEDQFIFNLLPTEAVRHERNFHKRLDDEVDLIQRELSSFKSLSNNSFHQIYLRFRKIYSELLSHLYDEETNLMELLCDRFSEQELRHIDHDIYKSMSADDMAAMVKELFPPCSFGEKLAVLEDLEFANPNSLRDAWPKMSCLFTEEELEKVSSHRSKKLD